MVRPIMRDLLFPAQKSEPATEADKQVVQVLLDTLKANQDRCVAWLQICASSDENAVFTRAFEEHRGQRGESRV